MHHRRPNKLAPFALCCTLIAASPVAVAAPSVDSNPASGGFITACGGISGTTGAHPPGFDLEHFYGIASTCVSQSFTGAATAASDASYANGAIANSAQGTVGFGFMQLAAQSAAPNNASFPYGSANAGWEDNWLLDAPSLTGQAGTVLVSLHVNGSWVLSGFAGGARITVRPYVDDERIVIVGAVEQALFGSSIFPTGVNETVQFTLPFVFGQSFDVGMFALLRAGLRSRSAVEGISTADANFTNTITWEGIDGVFAGDTLVTDYSLVSASGIDWRLPVAAIPEAPIWLAMLAGLGVLARKMRSKDAASGAS